MRYFTKLDVVHAFHRIRIAEGDEWLTAFRTRLGLFEWNVLPFGLSNGPGTFQRFINHVLREYLDVFCSAYVDDVLVYSDSRKEHRKHVNMVLEKLLDAGLHVDIHKCEFEVQETKYLGFIVKAGKGIRMDPEKTKAILEWTTPTSVKAVRRFVGFANYYRQFIDEFSDIIMPLTALTKKGVAFRWDDNADRAFRILKKAFVSAPMLAQYDPDRKTALEADASGTALGGTLHQQDPERGQWHPVAFFSQKLNPAQRNYPIHDRELLAIVECLKQWGSMLRGLQHFEVITDHKNLEYFLEDRQLSPRQFRWWHDLCQYNLTIRYRPGQVNAAADALSRRDQDDDDDEKKRFGKILLKNNNSGGWDIAKNPDIDTDIHKNEDWPAEVLTTRTGDVDEADPASVPGEIPATLEQAWQDGIRTDEAIPEIAQALRDEVRTLPPHLKIKISLADCSLDDEGNLRWRGRLWVPNHEPLRTGLIQEAHDSTLAGHPGRTETGAIIAKTLFWPGYVNDVRRFCRNCDVCNRSKVWRQQKQGFLQPLSIPERSWRDIAMDFCGPFPMSDGHDEILVITDRLTKGVILVPCTTTISAERLVPIFVDRFVRDHGFPTSIVSDRGPQFVSIFWKELCNQLGIQRKLSTAYHPQTDGQTERWNAEVERHLRNLARWDQSDWASHLPLTQLQLNGATATATGVSPFSMLHGYDLEVLPPPPATPSMTARLPRPVEAARKIADKIRKVTAWAMSNLAAAQEKMREQADKHRHPQPAYQVGDKVWLNLRNWRTGQPSKKLDDVAAKFEITEVLSPLSYRLNVPTGVHDVFHADLLRWAPEDPLPSQRRDDYQPPPVEVEGDDEYKIDEILATRLHGRWKKRQYLVKWTGYSTPTWEPEENLHDTRALEDFLTHTEPADGTPEGEAIVTG